MQSSQLIAPAQTAADPTQQVLLLMDDRQFKVSQSQALELIALEQPSKYTILWDLGTSVGTDLSLTTAQQNDTMAAGTSILHPTKKL